jgi:hypothetical protein
VDHLEPWEKGSRKTAGQTGMCGGVCHYYLMLISIGESKCQLTAYVTSVLTSARIIRLAHSLYFDVSDRYTFFYYDGCNACSSGERGRCQWNSI